MTEPQKRVEQFLKAIASQAWQLTKLTIPKPTISSPSADGDIDLHWKTKTYEILINIPGNPKSRVQYYADNHKSKILAGELSPEAAENGLLFWFLFMSVRPSR